MELCNQCQSQKYSLISILHNTRRVCLQRTVVWECLAHFMHVVMLSLTNLFMRYINVCDYCIYLSVCPRKMFRRINYSPRMMQSTTRLVRKLTSPSIDSSRVGLSSNFPVYASSYREGGRVPYLFTHLILILTIT